MEPKSEALEAREPLGPESRFRFRCHAGLACFNRCCRETAILLSPYEILRLSRRLGLSTGEFLRRYTRRADEGGRFLPLVLLKLTRQGACPFAGAQGCLIYEDRPAACRLFPVVQGTELTPSGLVERFFLRRLPYCEGFRQGPEWSLAEWLEDQGYTPFEVLRRPWLSLLARQAQPGQALPDDRILGQFYMVAYDLDAFRVFVLDSAFARIHGLGQEELQPVQKDDLALLSLSAAYLEHLLFPERALPLRASLEPFLRGAPAAAEGTP